MGWQLLRQARSISNISKLELRMSRPVSVNYSVLISNTSVAQSNKIKILQQEFQTDGFTNISSGMLDRLEQNLCMKHANPIGILKRDIFNILKERQFTVLDSFSPIVTVKENFDDLLIPKDHVSRSRGDSFFINQSLLLRTHTTVHDVAALRKCEGNVAVAGSVFRRDNIDRCHYPVFHQLDAVRLFPLDTSDSYIIACLKSDLSLIMQHLFKRELNCRWVDTYFPFTSPSVELEIDCQDRWLELLGAGVLRQEVLHSAGLLQHKAYAFGLGLERLAMAITGIDDIRLFWSKDERFERQWLDGKLKQFSPFSAYPHTCRDISFWITDSAFNANDFYAIIREFGCDLIQDVQLTKGPISLAEYMEACLFHPQFGYYARNDAIFGTDGDFVTAPEMGQLFGEMVGVFVANWAKTIDAPFSIVELGPGKGSLASDLFKTVSAFPPVSDALCKYTLVEKSDELRCFQQKTLTHSKFQFASRLDSCVQDDCAHIFIANEFFDALPIHLLRQTKDKVIEEILVSTASENSFALSPAATPTAISLLFDRSELPHVSAIKTELEDQEEVIFEFPHESVRYVQQIIPLLLQHNNSMLLLCDYGRDDVLITDSLRAIKRHRFVDPFTAPGHNDLTADVSFGLLKKAVEPYPAILCSEPVTQANFLQKMGIIPRVSLLSARHPAQKAALHQQCHKLVATSEMGRRFKFMCITNSSRLPYPF